VFLSRRRAYPLVLFIRLSAACYIPAHHIFLDTITATKLNREAINVRTVSFGSRLLYWQTTFSFYCNGILDIAIALSFV
jgi:hypothetical protein